MAISKNELHLILYKEIWFIYNVDKGAWSESEMLIEKKYVHHLENFKMFQTNS